MNNNDLLTDKNFILYCAKNYINPSCTGTDEFFEDLNRIKYIKKLITRYIETGDLKERLILNHLIVLNNVFRPTHLCRILFLKMEEQFSYIKPFLIMLSVLTERIDQIKNENYSIDTSNIIMDKGVIEALRDLVPIRI